ncbi:hypothetical protein BDA96_09G044400 [Sorghum bicolor]|uniref:Embryo surrounding factor 1 brassicaceae domain-containing protein n=2 Tax=Sorghum bicolor TaxID=4558 RepID=A0A921U311_SORBI|nr:hypothetical protein BDA96_09G044400 [Sorghum bicolor]KXG21295.1 hypothetical protein SORBI_3009G041900 [Sorghum bicolor]
MVKITMDGSKAVILLMVILGCFMIPTHSRNVVHMCPCNNEVCSWGYCYCCSHKSCFITMEDCWSNCRCPKVPHIRYI